MPSFLTSLTQIFSPSSSSTSDTLPSHGRDTRTQQRSSYPSSRSSAPNNQGNGSGNLGAYYDDAWDIPSSSSATNQMNPTRGDEADEPGSRTPTGKEQARTARPSTFALAEGGDRSRRTSYGYGYPQGVSPTGYDAPGSSEGIGSRRAGRDVGGAGSEKSSREGSPAPADRTREHSHDSSTSTARLHPDDHRPGTGPSQHGQAHAQAQARIKPRSSTFLTDASTSATTTTTTTAAQSFAYPPPRQALPGGGLGPTSGKGGMSYGWGGGGVGRNGTLDPRSSAIMSNRPVRNRVSSNQSFLSPNGPLQYYPPLNHTWSRIKASLLTHLPELHDSLAYPVDPKDLATLESALGTMLPPSVRDSYLCVDGQDSSSDCREGLFFGLTLLPLEDVLREWSFWRQVEHDPQTGMNPEVLAVMSSIPPGWIKRKYACKGWLPLIADRCGNYVGVDLDPGTSEEYQQYWGGAEEDQDGPGGVATANPSAQNNAGTWGQVIVFGREFDRKCVLWRGEGEGGWGRWLAGFAEELESGEGWEIDGASDRRGSDGEEDDIGYSSYYFDPSSGSNGSGGTYGEGGTGLRLTGEYRGWSVLEAWWDRSVRRWDELGLSVTYADLQREEEYRLRKAKGKQPQRGSIQGLGFGGMRIGGVGEDIEVPIPVMDEPDMVISSVPSLQAPPTPGPDTALLGARSPSMTYSDFPPETSSARRNLESLQGTDPLESTTSRLITPYSASTSIPTIEAGPSSPTDHPLQMKRAPSGHSDASSSRRTSREEGLLSPPAFSSPKTTGTKRASLPGNTPAPVALDLPTRADVQAAQAVATAEENGLRGGWVMSMEAVASSSALASRRHQQSPSDGSATGAPATRQHARAGSSYGKLRETNEMVDIDLEGGRRARFGSAPMTEQEARAEDAIRTEAMSDGARSPSILHPQDQTMESQLTADQGTSQETPKMSSTGRMEAGFPGTPQAKSDSATSMELATPIARTAPGGSPFGAPSVNRSASASEEEFSEVSLGTARVGNGAGTQEASATTAARSGGKRNSMILDKLTKAGLTV